MSVGSLWEESGSSLAVLRVCRSRFAWRIGHSQGARLWSPTMTTGRCPFCAPAAERVFYRDAHVVGLWDGFPVTPGHALLIPVRHVPTWFEASMEERVALVRATDVARSAIESK